MTSTTAGSLTTSGLAERACSGCTALVAMTGIADVLGRVTRKLDDAGIRYMVAGSFASAHFGTPRTRTRSERQRTDVQNIVDLRGATLDLVYIERWIDELGLRDE